MAPKGSRAKAAAKAGARGGIEIMKRKKEKLDKLQDILDAEEAAPRRKRELKRRTTDGNIKKKMRHNFPGFTEAELSMRLVSGLNVYDRLRPDMQKIKNKEPDAPTMGKLYYEELRKLYRDPNSPLGTLEPKDLNEPIDQELEDALEALVQTRRTTAEIHQWAENVKSINQLNLVAVFRQLLKMPPAKSLENANIGMSILRMCERLGVPQDWPDEFAVVRSHFDAVLIRTLAAYKSEDQASSAWWRVNRVAASLILPSGPMDIVMAASSDWAAIESEVLQIHESSAVGKRLMARAVRQLELEGIGRVAAGCLKDIAEAKSVTQEKINDWRDDFLRKAKLINIDPNKSYSPRKEVMVDYRGVKVPIIVTSAMGHFTVALESYIRGMACQLHLLPALWCEQELLETKKCDGKAEKIAPGLIKAASASRQACLDHLADEFASAQNIEWVLKSKKNNLTSVDRYFRIEMSFWYGSMGETASERVKAMILSCLPESAEKNKTLSQSVTMFARAAESKLLAFAGPSQQALFKTVNDWVLAMGNGRTPEIEKSGESVGFTLILKKRMELFFTYKGLVGAPAAKQKAADIKAAFADEEEMEYKELVPMLSFTWLLSKEDRAQVNAAVKKVVKAKSARGERAAASASDDVPAPTGKKQKSDAKAIVRGLFGKK